MRIKLYISTGFAGCNHEDVVEIPDDEWSALSPEEREQRLDDEAREFLGSHIDCGAYLLDD